MIALRRVHASRGFALLITLLLLSLLTLAVFGLSTLVKSNADLTATRIRQTRARENALLGLRMGLSELQRRAGPDDAITGMAGVSGIATGPNALMRHWCGVWNQDGSFSAWLTSGAQASGTAALQLGIDSVELVSNGSVGAASSNSEHVIAGKLAITVTGAPGAPRSPVTVGKYAFWVGDEGVKISAFAPNASVPPLIASLPSTSGPAKLRAAVDMYGTRLPRLISFEQLSVLPSPGAALTPGVLRDSFHHTTLTARMLDSAGQTIAGRINLNTNSSFVWRAVLETYNAVPGTSAQFSAAKLTSATNAIATGIAGSTSGKASNAPYSSLAAFMQSTLLSTAIAGPGGVSVDEFEHVMTPALATRSDTFRIRGYGETVNAFRPSSIEAAAYCEAIVQRTPTPLSGNLGRRFQIIYFRWLLPSDI